MGDQWIESIVKRGGAKLVFDFRASVPRMRPSAFHPEACWQQFYCTAQPDSAACTGIHRKIDIVTPTRLTIILKQDTKPYYISRWGRL